MKKIIYIFLFCIVAISSYAQNYEHIVNYNFNGTPTNGVKIKTNIPLSPKLGMPLIKIEGYNYANQSIGGNPTGSLNLNITWYVFDTSFVGTAVSSFGGSAPNIWLSNENGKVVIFLDQKIFYQRFTVSAFAQGMSEKPEYFQGWTVVDEPKGGTVQTLVPYKNVFGGNVGIGTETPQYPLDVTGKTRVSDELIVGNRVSGTPDGSIERLKIMPYYHTNPWSIRSRDTASEAFLDLAYATSSILSLRYSGVAGKRVGILTETPQYPLDVNGTIHAKEVLIDTNFPLADYVFKPDYKLMPLNELEQFVQTNSHLPEIPSAEEVAEKGLSVGEMQNKLLQKIEELTLYIIQQDKRIQELEKSQHSK